MEQSKQPTFEPLPAVLPPGPEEPEPAGPENQNLLVQRNQNLLVQRNQNLLVQRNQNLLPMVLVHLSHRGACWEKSGGERGCRGWVRGREKVRGGGGGQCR